jgi:hypothetical protein
MKKTGNWIIYAALILISGCFLAPKSVLSQQAQEKHLSPPSSQRISLAKLRSITGLNLASNPNVPALNMLQEPQFTKGDSNIVYWDKVDCPASAEACKILVFWGPDLDKDYVTEPELPAGSDSIKVGIPNKWHGKVMFYQAIFLAMIDGKWQTAPESLLTVVSSIQDVKAPTLDSIKIQAVNGSLPKNGWFNSKSINLYYYGLKDSAGLYSAFISGSIQATTILYPGEPDGSPKLTQVDSSFSFTLNDSIYDPIYFGACDAAYSPESHGEVKVRGAVWQIAGNCDSSLARGTIKIDTQPPTIKFSDSSSVYSPKNPVIKFTISDMLSGVDPESIKITFTPSLPVPPDIEKTIAGDTCYVTIDVSKLDTTMISTLSVSASDSAGNPASDSKQVQFIFEPPGLVDFRMVDLDFDTGICLNPDSSYTNSTVVLLNSFVFKNKIADSLLIIGKNDSVVVPYQPQIRFDIKDVTDNIQSGDRLGLTIKGKDRFDNVDSVGPKRSLFFDDQISAILVKAADSTSVEDDARNGAYSGWTNNRNVRVSIKTADRDLYNISQSSPVSSCFDADTLDFRASIPDNTNKEWLFTYQVGDSAGNPSKSALDSIKLDTSIYQPNSTDFKVFDCETDSEEFTAADSVCIIFKDWSKVSWKGGKGEIVDLSRIVVDNVVYTVSRNDTLHVPTGNGIFILSVIDSAGNESKAIPDTIAILPRFKLVLFDIEPPLAQTGYTNDPVIGWDLGNKNFEEADIKKLELCVENTSMCDTTWRVGDQKRIVHGLLDSALCVVKARVALTSGAISDWIPSSIIFDNRIPKIDTLKIDDHIAYPKKDKDEEIFTNKKSIAIELTTSIDVDSVSICDVKFEKVTDNRYQYSLNPANKLDIFDLSFAVRDSAGNESVKLTDQITYLEQNISVSIDTTKPLLIAESVVEINPIVFIPVSYGCEYPEYLSKVVVDFPPENGVPRDTTFDIKNVEHDFVAHRLRIPIRVDSSGTYVVSIVDSAGNVGGDSIKIKILHEPEISLKLYDYYEFREKGLNNADSEFTDGRWIGIVNGDSTALLKAVIERDSDGSWAEYRIGPGDIIGKENLPWLPIPDPALTALIIDVPLVRDATKMVETLTYSAQVRDAAGSTDSATASIVYDMDSPSLTNFSPEKNVIDLDTINQDSILCKIQIKGNDDSPGQVSGIVIGEFLKDPSKSNRHPNYLYCRLDSFENNTKFDLNIYLLPVYGLRTLKGFLIDKSDDGQEQLQKLVLLSGQVDADSLRAHALFSHPSNVVPFQVRINRKEVSAYPNPFDPKQDNSVKFIFYVDGESIGKDKTTTEVEIQIFDPFGNLVKTIIADCISGLNDGYFNTKLRWDGKNDKGGIVANGGYICVIKGTGILEKLKIAVLKQ